MTFKFNGYITTIEQLSMVDRTNPFLVAACAVNIMNTYDPSNPDKYYELLQYLMEMFSQ